jgi:hypothetical protein
VALDLHHDLVEEFGPVTRLPHADQRLALTEPRERDQVRLTEPLADLRGLDEGIAGRPGVTDVQFTQRAGKQHVTAHDRVVQPRSSSSRWARAIQPPPRCSSPRPVISTIPSQKAHRTAASSSPRSR